MAFTKGDLVAVRVLGGEEVILRFWEQRGKMILVTNDDEYDRLIVGLKAPWPVAFHPEEVRMVKIGTHYMRPRTKITLPNPSESEFDNFDRFVRIVLSRGKPAKNEERPKAKPQARKRLPRP